MDQVLTGTVQGNTIVFDAPLAVPDGQTVEVVLRESRHIPQVGTPASQEGESPPAWWTADDDRILDEVYQSRKRSTRPETAA